MAGHLVDPQPGNLPRTDETTYGNHGKDASNKEMLRSARANIAIDRNVTLGSAALPDQTRYHNFETTAANHGNYYCRGAGIGQQQPEKPSMTFQTTNQEFIQHDVSNSRRSSKTIEKSNAKYVLPMLYKTTNQDFVQHDVSNSRKGTPLKQNRGDKPGMQFETTYAAVGAFHRN